MSKSQTAYRQVFKATSLFSGVQIVNIIAAIIRSKFAALFIGPVGIGVLGVLNSTVNLISGVTKLGLDTSSIKEIAFANNSGNEKQVHNTIYTLKRLLWITGIVGTIITIILSSFLSEIAFDSKEYTFSIILISSAILFKQLTVGDLAVLQGLRKLKKLAQVNLYSSLCSVVIAVPLFYFMGLKGIVPTIILTALFAFLIARYFTFSDKIEAEHKSLLDLFQNGKTMIKLGVTLSIGGFITLFVAYVMQVFITNIGGLTEVGYYNAGIVIINSYVGLIFKAMTKDYFPRLSEIINNTNKVKQTVIQQATVAILLITPIIIVFLAFSEYAIRILYSKEFLPIIAFLTFAIVGTLFKAVSWSMGYVIIAKGDSKVFIKTAIGFNFILLTMNILSYYYYGLLGLGISFMVYYLIHLIGIGLIMKYRYSFSFDFSFLKVYSICLIFAFLALSVTYINNIQLKYVLLAVLIVASCIFTVAKLDKEMDFISFLKDRIK